MEKEEINPFVDYKLFCPNCRKKVEPIRSEKLREIVHTKAKEVAQKTTLEKVLETKNYSLLRILTQFKKLEDSCEFCPECGWSPFENFVSENVLRSFIKENQNEIEKVEGSYLLDILFPEINGTKRGTKPKGTIKDLFHKG